MQVDSIPSPGEYWWPRSKPYPRGFARSDGYRPVDAECDHFHCHAPVSGSALSGRSALAATDLRAQPHERVVVTADHALLHRDDRVVGDLDVLGADLGAALRDVAHPDALFVAGEVRTVFARVERVHVELGRTDEETGSGERLLVVLVVTHDVAGVLAEEALDALAELLRALDVDLLHPVVAGRHPLGRGERRDLAGLRVVEGHVGHEVADDREGTHRRHGDRLGLGERRHPGHAQQPRHAVDLGAARTALAGLAVPTHREVTRLGGLDAVDDVEHDLALVDLDGVVDELAAVGVAAPDPEPRVVAHDPLPSMGVTGAGTSASSSGLRYLASPPVSKRASRSPRMAGIGCSRTTIPSRSAEQMRLRPRQRGSIVG